MAGLTTSLFVDAQVTKRRLVTLSNIKLELSTDFPHSPLALSSEELLLQVAQDLDQAEATTLTSSQPLASMPPVDLHDSLAATRYGHSVQEQLPEFTQRLLQIVGHRDISDLGQLLSSMRQCLLDFNEPDHKDFFNLFRRAQKLNTLRIKYDQTSHKLEQLQKGLQRWQLKLSVEVKQLDELYQQVCTAYAELVQCLLAGRSSLASVYSAELQALKQRASTTQAAADALALQSYSHNYSMFEQRLSDLELTKTSYQQTALQIQLNRQTSQQLIAQIQTSLNEAITAWQRNVALAFTAKPRQAVLHLGNQTLLEAIESTIRLQEGSEQLTQSMSVNKLS